MGENRDRYFNFSWLCFVIFSVSYFSFKYYVIFISESYSKKNLSLKRQMVKLTIYRLKLNIFQLSKQQHRLDSDPQGGRLLHVVGLHQIAEYGPRGPVPLLHDFVSRFLWDSPESWGAQSHEGGLHQRASATKGKFSVFIFRFRKIRKLSIFKWCFHYFVNDTDGIDAI